MLSISIKSARVKRGITQKELAEMLKVSQSSVAQWENGISGPKRARLSEIACVLECDVGELIKEEG